MENYIQWTLVIVNAWILNSKQSLISKHFWWNWAIVLQHAYLVWEKNSAHSIIRDKYFQIFLQLSVLKPYLYKNFKLWIHEFVNRIAFTCIFGIWISKMKSNITYMIIRFLEKILPTRLLDPTRLLISEKSSHLHCY